MSQKLYIHSCLAIILAWTNALTLQAQEQEAEMKLNENAIKMIQFDFTQNEKKTNRLLEAPMDKQWMKFKESVPFKRSFADTTTVKKIEGFVRAQPFTPWTRYGENPITEVMPTLEKKWTFHWKLNPFRQTKEEYGRTIEPSAGKMYESVTNPMGSGVSISVDFDKLLYESLTKRGRAIRRNRKNANAWKIYADYVPTKADHNKFPSFRDTLRYAPLLIYPEPSDSASRTESSAGRNERVSRQPERNTEPAASSIEEYIRRRAAEDSIRRKEFLRRDKARSNMYDVEKQKRLLKEQQ